MENNEEQQATMDFEAIHERQNEELTELLDRRDMKRLQQRLEDMQEFDVAEFLSEIGDNRMPMVFRLLSKETAAEVFANFDAPEQEQVINSITDSELSGILEELYVDDAVDMMEELPANVVKRVMRTATPETRKLINQYLHYPENSAGSIMTAEFIDLKKYMSVRESIARIRRIGEDKETIYICFVTSADRKLEGIVPQLLALAQTHRVKIAQRLLRDGADAGGYRLRVRLLLLYGQHVRKAADAHRCGVVRELMLLGDMLYRLKIAAQERLVDAHGHIVRH